jgi:hypothetical protein
MSQKGILDMFKQAAKNRGIQLQKYKTLELSPRLLSNKARTGQDQTRQGKTRQGKTRGDKTRQIIQDLAAPAYLEQVNKGTRWGHIQEIICGCIRRGSWFLIRMSLSISAGLPQAKQWLFRRRHLLPTKTPKKVPSLSQNKGWTGILRL